ncbi:cyclin h-1 [Plasmopara halstedii]|uniref:Cyclin h-1 n=1 Tax=Plasmopara halstedii TaxID=4781 RepID=A0A0P1A825_PLAHL|nr:cyclin h-1 [Plasmopara halstedii]CEG36180.1 cyclin h-1 [Plasmopara halstedii]|eukprot:XP_024572549.1 cyclin h-1 [Plasmopara halstedii]
MSYLAASTHLNNWVFSIEDLQRVRRLQHVKTKRALRLEREEAQKPETTADRCRKARSFAALVPSSSSAVRDVFDWNDEIDGNLSKLEEEEEKANLQLTPLLEFLDPGQEAVLRQFYEEKLQESCSAQFLRTSDKVKCCAMLLFKRFYLSNSVMEFHPKYLVPTAIYVAGKVEEQYMSVDTIADQLHVNHKFIIGHEMILLEGVRFQLIMYHPFRALLGFLDDFRAFAKQALKKDLPATVLQKLHANSSAMINDILLTDLPILYYPSFLALAALWDVTDEVAASSGDKACGLTSADLVDYIKRSKFSKEQPVDELLSRLMQIIEAFRAIKIAKEIGSEEGTKQRAKHIKQTYKKLKQFHNGDDKKEKQKDKRDKKRAGGFKDGKKKVKKHKKDKSE